MVILGIDPGSRVTGYGVIERKQGKLVYVASGCIRVGTADLPSRLANIYTGISDIIRQYNPAQFAIEQVFMAKKSRLCIEVRASPWCRYCGSHSR